MRYVELGPGRGTLAADALRAMRAAGLDPAVHLVETSPVLRAAQASPRPGRRWHDDLATLPDDGPILAVANEFFDALPVRQLVATAAAGASGGSPSTASASSPSPARRCRPPAIPAHVRAAPPGTVLEASPASLACASAGSPSA